MGLGTNNTTVTTSDKFIPDIWSDEVLARYKQALVLGNLVTKVNFKGKKGDTLHLPVPARGTPSAKAANTQVTLIADTATEVLVVVNKHYEYSKLYEDIAEMQSLSSMRKFYTDDGGYALAKQVDQDIALMAHYFQSGNTTPSTTNVWNTAVIGGDGSTAFAEASSGNGTALTDAGLRKMIQTLEDADIPSNELKFVIPPVEMNVLRSISRFTEQAFVGNGNALKTGMMGNLYGVEVFVSSNCPWLHVNNNNSNEIATNFSSTTLAGAYTDAFGLSVDFTSDTDTKYRVCTLMHKDGIALAEQQSIRTQAQYKQEYLGTLVTTDSVYGVKNLRTYAGICCVVPS
jgi:hypothetical protein